MYAPREAAWIVEAATGVRTAALLLEGGAVGDARVDAALALASRRSAGEPLQYVTGVAGFRGLELAVGPGVFIPRPETELVAQRALDALPPGGVAVDVGTGSGAIALSLALERPDAIVYGTDSSPDALAYARRNRAAAGVRAHLIECHLLDGLPPRLEGAVDVVVSNPPYVPRSQAASLPRDVVAHEPAAALFGGEDGLELVAAVADAARRWLRPSGRLVCEIGYDQGAGAARLLRRAGYADIEV
ncbi:MAG TPA: peptide chain release factor N(5)-glutamine methyltransferase, partial [Actinomycetota bacterium]|nr:peptide chain release factor N(5)-glutamine methyltransferase [Actinomycetota bacterium]